MKALRYTIAAMIAALMMAGCSDEKVLSSGEGQVTLNTTISADVQRASSRSTQAELKSQLNDSFIFWLTRMGAQNNDVIRAYQGLDNMPSTLTLAAGNYLAECWAGDSVSASFDKRWFKGAASFAVSGGSTTNVNLDCKIANVVVSFEYENIDEITSRFDINSVTVKHARGSLDFTDREHERGYFMMPSTDKDLAWQLDVTRKADNTITQYGGKLKDVKPGYEYHFVISLESQPQGGNDDGGAFLNIVVNEEEIPAFGSVVIDAAPTIKGVGFDIEEPVVASSSLDPFAVYLTATSAMTSVKVTCSEFPTLLGLSNVSFDVFGAQQNVVDRIKAHGVDWQYGTITDEVGVKSDLKFYFREAFTSSLQTETNYSITIDVTDANGLKSSRTFTLLITQAPISVTVPSSTGVDAAAGTNSYTVEGEVLSDLNGQDVNVYYAPSSRADWQMVKATVSGNRYSAVINGLSAGVKYDYYVSVGSFTSQVYSFSTINPQLPNSGFEDWQTGSTPYLIYAAGGDMFWDSGNHGSATMKKNVTVPDATYKHSGNYAIKLCSQFVGVGAIGKFAAGNVFIGQYLATEGTDGVLGFGRPFKYRPTKIRGYVRYEPVAISHVSSDAPAEYVKGELDKGIIYAALLDGTTPDSQYPNFPVIIKTKSKQLFDKNGSNVIGYGEIVFSEATAGSGMVQFELPITYNSNATPSFIMLTASASKGGDYFTGGSGSNMWLDDIELVYE